MNFARNALLGLMALCCMGIQSLSAQDTLQVMYYNVLNYPGSTSTRVEYFRTLTSYAKPDVLLINELISDDGALLLLNDGLNTGGEISYQKAQFTNGLDSDNMLFYNSDKVALYSQDTIDTALRLINEYVLYFHGGNPVGNDTSLIYFYSAHLKASTGTTNKLKRMAEVMLFKQHLLENAISENIIFGGDLNFYTNSEPAYDSLILAGPVPLTDPLPAGSWHDSPTYAAYHTQSPRTEQFGGGAHGGIDDRFDFILFSDDVINGDKGVTYVPNSCTAFGNDGLHFNKSLLDTPINPQIPDSVIQAIYYMSDHLPVICKIAVENPQPLSRNVDVRLFLEGPFNDGVMVSQTGFNIPIQQPYNQEPWNYAGTEMLVTPIGEDILDWVLLEIRETTGEAPSAGVPAIIWQQACVLTNDGQVLAVDQSSLPVLDFPATGNLFVVVHHRNHLDAMAALPMQLLGENYSYLFYDAIAKTFGGSLGIKPLQEGVWGIAAGDSDANGIIDNTDFHNSWILQTGHNGYLPADVNFDNQVDNADKNEKWIWNLGKVSMIPE